MKTAVALALVLHLLLICAAAASPELHEWMHAHASHDAGHDCAVTLFASGACSDAPPPLLAPAPEWGLVAGIAIGAAGLVAAFRYSGILEHAPPRGA